MSTPTIIIVGTHRKLLLKEGPVDSKLSVEVVAKRKHYTLVSERHRVFLATHHLHDGILSHTIELGANFRPSFGLAACRELGWCMVANMREIMTHRLLQLHQTAPQFRARML
jgi:hypothetical protein